ncbi:MAG: hypothetical protein WDO24_19810 [Pseudomonadota bacterium]
MAVLAERMTPPALRRLWAQGTSAQGLVSLLVLVVCGALVLYPVLFLIEESLNVGDAQEFPPTVLGLANLRPPCSRTCISSTTPHGSRCSPPRWRSGSASRWLGS